MASQYYITDNSDIENETFNAAKSNYLKENYNIALKLYLSLLNTNISYKLCYEIGRCYYKLNNITNAENYFRKSISMERLKNPSYLFLGNIYFKNNELNKAIENWSYAYAYQPDNEAVCLNLATSYFSKNMKNFSFYYYEKYLKYAENKNSSYDTVQTSIESCKKNAKEHLEKAKKYISQKNYKSAIEILTTAIKNVPTSFDLNYYLGLSYFEKNLYMQSMIYMKEALCIDNKSVDVLQKLSLIYIKIGDYTSAYCCLKRLLPLIRHNQKEYLATLQSIKEISLSLNKRSFEGHLEWANKYYNDNNYTLSLFEYENCIILNEKMNYKLQEKIERLKTILYPEKRIINSCLEKGIMLFDQGNFKISNKYFSKVLIMSNPDSYEYKLAKSKITNV